jgi:hypothetical protein
VKDCNIMRPHTVSSDHNIVTATIKWKLMSNKPAP